MKSIITSAKIALIINLIGMFINLISYLVLGKLLLCITYTGGDWIGQQGFGLFVDFYYPLTLAESSIQSTTKISFDFMSFIFSFLVCFLICLISHQLKKHA